MSSMHLQLVVLLLRRCWHVASLSWQVLVSTQRPQNQISGSLRPQRGVWKKSFVLSPGDARIGNAVLIIIVPALPASSRHLGGLLLSRGPSFSSDSSAPTFRALDEAAVSAADIRRAELLEGKLPEPKGEGSNNGRGASPSSRPWELAMHDALASTAADLNAVWRRSEPGPALGALGAAVAWLPAAAAVSQQLRVATASSPVLFGPSDAAAAWERLAAASGIDDDASADAAEEAAATITQDNVIDVKIERLLQMSGTAVRVHAVGRGGDLRPMVTKSAQTMAITDAAQAFDAAWLGGGVAAALPRAATSAGMATGVCRYRYPCRALRRETSILALASNHPQVPLPPFPRQTPFRVRRHCSAAERAARRYTRYLQRLQQLPEKIASMTTPRRLVDSAVLPTRPVVAP